MVAALTPISGVGGFVRFGTDVDVYFKNWTVTGTMDTVDYASSNSGGYGMTTGAITRYTAKVEFVVDGGDTLLSTLYAGATFDDCYFFRDAEETDLLVFSNPQEGSGTVAGFISRAEFTHSVGAVLTATLDLVFNGAVAYS